MPFLFSQYCWPILISTYCDCLGTTLVMSYLIDLHLPHLMPLNWWKTISSSQGWGVVVCKMIERENRLTGGVLHLIPVHVLHLIPYCVKPKNQSTIPNLFCKINKWSFLIRGKKNFMYLIMFHNGVSVVKMQILNIRLQIRKCLLQCSCTGVAYKLRNGLWQQSELFMMSSFPFDFCRHRNLRWLALSLPPWDLHISWVLMLQVRKLCPPRLSPKLGNG